MGLVESPDSQKYLIRFGLRMKKTGNLRPRLSARAHQNLTQGPGLRATSPAS